MVGFVLGTGGSTAGMGLVSGLAVAGFEATIRQMWNDFTRNFRIDDWCVVWRFIRNVIDIGSEKVLDVLDEIIQDFEDEMGGRPLQPPFGGPVPGVDLMQPPGGPPGGGGNSDTRFNVPNVGRHDARRLNPKMPDTVNTIVIDDWQTVIDDVSIINDGKAINPYQGNGNYFGVRQTDGNMRVYSKDGRTRHLFPISGSGFVNINRSQFKILAILNRTKGNMSHPELVNNPSLQNPDDRRVALEIWQLLNS